MNDKVQSVVGDTSKNRDRSKINVSSRKDKKTWFLGVALIFCLIIMIGVIGYKLASSHDQKVEREKENAAVSSFEAGKVDSVAQESDNQITQLLADQKAKEKKAAKEQVSREAQELEKQKQELLKLMANYKQMQQQGGTKIVHTDSSGHVVNGQPAPRVSRRMSSSSHSYHRKKEITPEMRKRMGSVTIELADNHQNMPKEPPKYDDSFSASHFEDGQAGLRKRGALDFMLIHGTSIPCALYTQIISDYEGFVTCRVTQDVYSANGAVLLIERGSLVSGTQKVAMETGKARIFTNWADVETPQGVSIQLDSLGAGALGASGSEAWVDNHFMQRFGGAILLSFVDDALDSASQQSNNDGKISFNNSTDNTEDMASKALDSSINIKPTGYAYIGQRINILVARDIDMSSVYQFGEEGENDD